LGCYHEAIPHIKEVSKTEMWRSKKFILVTALTAVLLIGSIGSIAFAAENSSSQPKARNGALLDKVCEIYQQKTGVAIDKEVLKESFAQAMSEMRPQTPPARTGKGPEAMQDRLKKLVDDGKITQEQLDALNKWWESRPDVPLGFGPPAGPGKFRGMGGPCIPPPPAE